MRVCAITVLLGVLVGASAAGEKTVADYPQLKNLFPFGMYVAAERIGEYDKPDYPTHMGRPMMEPYRRDLLDMARHYINVIAVENTAAIPLPTLRRMLKEGERAGILMWASENSLPKDEELEAWAESRLAPLKDEKGLIAWAPFDEPYPEHIPRWLKLKKVFETADPNHPVIAVTCGGPKGFEQYDVVQAADYYPVFVDNPDAWSVAPFVRRYVDATPKPIWFVVQAFHGEGRRLPTIAEGRMMTYMALAEGAKGIFYFIYDHLTTHYNAPTPLWDDIGKLGRELRAIGPEMLDTRVDRQSPLVHFTAEPNKDSHRPKDLPPAVCSILTSPAGHAFAIVYNTSVEEPAEVNLSVSAEAGSRRLYGLCSLVEANRDPGAKSAMKVRLEPGDGRILLLSDAAAYKRIAREIRTNCYHAEKKLLSLDREVAGKWDVSLERMGKLAAQAAKAIDRGSASEGLALILDARAAYTAAAKSAPKYSAARRELDGVFHGLTNLEQAMAAARERDPAAIDQAKKWQLDGFVCRYLELEHQFTLGDTSVTERAKDLLGEVDEAVDKLSIPQPATADH